MLQGNERTRSLQITELFDFYSERLVPGSGWNLLAGALIIDWMVDLETADSEAGQSIPPGQ